ncbi:CHAT domain-containing tetratricopeptide repeat protein [Phaeodactylibacter luteus]|uniref:CHAT domain-containing protein n=1 Tax=Phaeodactylibacter luteus TaxID=1564516 RepID=A0A5C6S0B9_9BACT|nr:CHAT domain-containing protein [Phaeodactylibacter luteus]TXB67971.1 CHAT domain-containing protein [Phaeodactylibacter luteus]
MHNYCHLLLLFLALSFSPKAAAQRSPCSEPPEDCLKKGIAELENRRIAQAVAIGEAIMEETGPGHPAYPDLYARALVLVGTAHLYSRSVSAAPLLEEAKALQPECGWYAKGLISSMLGIEAIYRGAWAEALPLLKDAVGHYRPGAGAELRWAQIYTNLGQVHMQQGAYDAALSAFAEAEQLFGSYQGAARANLHNNRGLVFTYTGRYRQAVEEQEQTLEIRARTLGDSAFEVFAAYVNLGLAHLYQYQLSEAEAYLAKAEQLTSLPGIADYKGYVYTNLGVIAERRKAYEEAVAFFEKAYAAEQLLYPPGDPELAVTLFNIGAAFYSMGDYENARAYLGQALSGAQPSHPQYNLFLMHLGMVELKEGRKGEAKAVLQRALKQQLEQASPFHPTVADLYGHLSETVSSTSQKLEYLEQAKKCLQYQGPESLGQALDMPRLCEVLDRYARVLANAGGPRWQAAIEEALLAYEQMALSASYQQDQLALRERAQRFYSYAVGAAVRSGNTPLAFERAERSKAMVLYQALREANTLSYAGIPDSLVRKEEELAQELAFLESQIRNQAESGIPPTAAAVQQLKAAHLQAAMAYKQLKDGLSSRYPDFFKARFELSVPSLDEVQSRLEPGESLVEYVVGDSAIYLFLVQPGSVSAEVLERDGLEEQVLEMVEAGIYGYYTLPESARNMSREVAALEAYTRSAQALYERLWAPIAEQVGKKVTIVPGGALHNVPFGALLQQPPPRVGLMRAYDYLVQQHCISYAYSATLLHTMSEKDMEALPLEVLAVAPFSDPATAVGPWGYLAQSRLELDAIRENWPVKAIEGGRATVRAILDQAPGFPILHFSTHGLADNESGDFSCLLFAGEPARLYARDIYPLPLKARLVFLSACETGRGRLILGEGMISLARAFAYAGAQSIITTLWQVDEGASAEITAGFYERLWAGAGKDEALHAATLSYLEEARGQGMAAHPFFWAGFLPMGDMSPIR